MERLLRVLHQVRVERLRLLLIAAVFFLKFLCVIRPFLHHLRVKVGKGLFDLDLLEVSRLRPWTLCLRRFRDSRHWNVPVNRWNLGGLEVWVRLFAEWIFLFEYLTCNDSIE